MTLGPVTKLDKRNKTTSKKFDIDVTSENYDVIPDSEHRVCKNYVFSNRNLLSYKT